MPDQMKKDIDGYLERRIHSSIGSPETAERDRKLLEDGYRLAVEAHAECIEVGAAFIHAATVDSEEPFACDPLMGCRTAGEVERLHQLIEAKGREITKQEKS